MNRLPQLFILWLLLGCFTLAANGQDAISQFNDFIQKGQRAEGITLLKQTVQNPSSPDSVKTQFITAYIKTVLSEAPNAPKSIQKLLSLADFIQLLEQNPSSYIIQELITVTQTEVAARTVWAERYPEIWGLFEAVERICRKKNHWAQLCLLYTVKGNFCFYDVPRMAEANSFYEKALSIAKEHLPENSPIYTTAYMQLINNQFGVSRDLEAAQKLIDEAAPIFKKHKSPQWANLQQIHIAIAKDKGDFDKALSIAQETQNECAGDPTLGQLYHSSAVQIADAYSRKGEFKPAEKLYVQSIDYFRKTPDMLASSFWLPTAMSARMRNLHYWGKTDSVTQLIEEIRRLPNQPRFEFFFPTLLRHYIKTNNITAIKAQQLYVDYLRSRPSIASEAPVWVAFAEAFEHIGETALAAEFMQTAQQLLQLPLNSSRSENPKVIDPLNSLQFLSAKIRFLRKTQPSANYQPEVELAISILDQLRQSYSTKGAKELLLNDALFLYEAALDLYYQQGTEKNLEKLFLLSEKSKSILLLEALQEGKAREFANIPTELRKKENSLLNDVLYYEAQASQEPQAARKKQLQQTLYNKRKELDSLKAELGQKYPKYVEYKYQQKVPTIAQIQSQLPQGALMLHYFCGQSSLYVFCISPQRAQVFKMGVDNSFYQRIFQFAKRNSDPYYIHNEEAGNFSLFCQDSYWAYEQLLGAFSQELAQAKRLIIIPDGVLHYLPFELLLSEAPKADKTNYQQLPYLLKKYSFSYGYSAVIWEECWNKPASKNTAGILAFAPSYQTKTLPPKTDLEQKFAFLSELDGVKREVEWLQQFFKGAFYTRQAATEAQFKRKASQYNILHLSMHGVLDDNPAYTGLYFCPNRDTSEDNALLAYEIPALELDADLVLLSACETGLGRYQYGEGVISLGRSFMYAGAPAVIATLWSVNDNTAVFLVEHFYQQLHQGKSKDEALQAAKLAYLDQAKGNAAHPFYWAGFTLQGNPKPIPVPTKTSWLWWALGASGLSLLGYFIYKKQLKSNR